MLRKSQLPKITSPAPATTHPLEPLLNNPMTLKEPPGGPAGPKVLRLLYFVGAGFICSFAMNKWRELEQKSSQQPKLDRQDHQQPAK